MIACYESVKVSIFQWKWSNLCKQSVLIFGITKTRVGTLIKWNAWNFKNVTTNWKWLWLHVLNQFSIESNLLVYLCKQPVLIFGTVHSRNQEHPEGTCLRRRQESQHCLRQGVWHQNSTKLRVHLNYLPCSVRESKSSRLWFWLVSIQLFDKIKVPYNREWQKNF